MKRYVLIAFMVFCAGCMGAITPEPLPPQSEDALCLLLVVHGSGNTAADWPADLVAKVKTVIPQAGRWDIVAYDWSTYAEDKLSAADAGIEIGTAIGATLSSSSYNYERIQFVAHSVGSFVIQAACDAYRAHVSHATRIHLTFLDPFTGRGLLDWTYGTKRFGEGADFAEAYINTSDPAPSTNGMLRNAHNFDVTGEAPATLTGRDLHWWPV
ncbi:MAG: hypothetical protein NTV89_03275 [Proteobacteria bacterium]|nr:hypothetical protein [Pseudomonadota bacterium]